jgi:pilus assembly protein CpaF
MAFALDLLKPGESQPVRRLLDDGTFLIGRGASCHIQLPFPDISERHAMLSVHGATAQLNDLHSANGTYLNGLPLEEQALLNDDTVIQIGSCVLRVVPVGATAAPSGAPAPRRETAAAPAEDDAPPAPDPQQTLRRQIKEQIHRELVARLNLKRLAVNGVNRTELEQKATEKIHEIIAFVQNNGKLPPDMDPAALAREVFNEAMRLGPLEDLLADPAVTEIMVNAPDRVYVERDGKLQLTSHTFLDSASIMAVIERIVAPIGRRIDESQPYVDARLEDGSRVNAIIPPLALSGPTVTIRKFSKKALTVDDFIRFGTWTHNAAEFMKACVMMRKNIVVAGGTGSGKTSLLNVLSGFIPSVERIITVEDAAELRLLQPHVVRLEARPPNIEGRGAVTIRDLVRNCLRMRPDRIIVGECRGGEALDMLQAMNTGHDGSLTTVHANSPRDVISRLETMVLMGGMELPSRAIREQIASAVDLIIHESRLSDGSRKVMAISEVTGMEGQNVVMQDLFSFQQRGVDPHGRVIGEFRPTGAVPTFFEHLASRGLRLDPALFDPSRSEIVHLERTGEGA